LALGVSAERSSKVQQAVMRSIHVVCGALLPCSTATGFNLSSTT